MLCTICQNESSEPPNEIVICDKCGQGTGAHRVVFGPVLSVPKSVDPLRWSKRSGDLFS